MAGWWPGAHKKVAHTLTHIDIRLAYITLVVFIALFYTLAAYQVGDGERVRLPHNNQQAAHLYTTRPMKSRANIRLHHILDSVAATTFFFLLEIFI